VIVKKFGLPAVLTSAYLFGMQFLNVPVVLGAHPLWAMKVVLIGLILGLSVSVVFHLIRTRRLKRYLLLCAALIAAFSLAHYGKTQFAASYAEDVIAGKFWFFGWIASVAALAALISTALSR
jgi:hypothetical protein